jgi:hypothetical protein
MGQLPGAQETMRVESLTFGKITGKNEQGLITGFEPITNSVIPYGEKSFSVKFIYTGPAPKQNIWKVYVNGREDQSLRIISDEDISGGNTWYRTFGYEYTNVFILPAGEYVVELYADAKFVQHGIFYVQE